MNIFTAVFQDESVHPPLVEVFASREGAEEFLLSHYSSVWDRSNARGEMPRTWQEICQELEGQGRLSACDIVYTQKHEIDPFA